MRVSIALALVIMLVQVAIDYYLLTIARKRSKSRRTTDFVLWQGAFFLAYIAVFICLPKRDDSNSLLLFQMWMLFSYISVYAGKLLFVVFDLIASIPNLLHKKRLHWLTKTGAILGVTIVAAMWWGALINRYKIQINEVIVEIPDLPDSFNNYKIAQISDLHVGTFGNDTTFIHKLVETVNAQHANLIVFTGDIVNRRTIELDPFVKPLSRLYAPDGVISILGNHDYGDYFNWPDTSSKEENMELLMDRQIEMGWELLTNSSTTIYGQNANDSIIIVGVENWGDPPFPTYGNLTEAYPTPSDKATKILLTHNPAHWVEAIAPSDTMNFALTLSGHTHAMQMELAGYSPAVFRYRTWGGMYQSPDSLRPLYVNIGAGTVGIPMRLGATPEITIFTITPPSTNAQK